MREAALSAAQMYADQGDERGQQRAMSYAIVAYSAADEDDLAQHHVELLLSKPLEDDVLGRTLLVATWLALPRDAPTLVGHWTRLVDTLERIDRLSHWYECSPLPGFIGRPGMREPLLRYVAGVQRRLPEQPVPLSGMIQVTQGWLHLWAGQWEATAETIRRAEADCRWLGRPTNLLWQLHMLKALALAIQGDVAGSRAAANVVLDDALALTDPTQRAAYVARCVHYAQRVASIAEDDLRVAELNALIEAHRHDAQWFFPPAVRKNTDAYIAMAQGRAEEACALWKALLEDDSRIGVFGQIEELRLRLAVAHAAARRFDDAAQVLQPLFAHVASSGEFGMAMTAGPRILTQLAAVPWGQQLAAAQQQLLRDWAAASRALRGQSPAVQAVARPGTAVAPELLSPRELEVLERIAAGDSNKLIARAFDLSPHTVKRHVANVLDKLGLSSRGQAAAWYRTHS